MSDSLREAEIRPDELMAEQARRFEADVAWLLTQRDRFVEVDCPACDAGERAPAWRKYEMDWVRCAACATVYLSPRPAPEVMAEYYATSQNYEYWNRVIFPASEGARREKIFRPRAERIADIEQRHGHGTGAIVDVGAREAHVALGDGRKTGPRGVEVGEMYRLGRRSLVAARALPAGAPLTADAITVKRPGFGIAPKHLELVTGLRVTRDVEADEVLVWDMLRE